MSRNYKNIGNYDLIIFNNNTHMKIGTLESGAEVTLNVAVTFGVTIDTITNLDNFYIGYTTGTSYSSTTINKCPCLTATRDSTTSYVIMIQYFGASSSNNYVTLEPQIIENGNVTLTNNIGNCTLSLYTPLTSSIVINSTINYFWFIPTYALNTFTTDSTFSYRIIATPNDGYTFNSSGATGILTYSDSTTLNATIDYDTNITYTLDVDTTKSPKTAVFTAEISGESPTKEFNLTTSLTNCSMSYTPSPAYSGDTITITLTADTGYLMTSAYISYTDSAGGQTLLSGTISSDKSTATIVFDTSLTNSTTAIVTGLTELSTDVPIVSIQFINVDTITGDNLKTLSTKRWIVSTSTGGTETIDLAYYIQSLKKFYCNIGTSLEHSLVLGTYDTEITVNSVSSDYTELNCGSVTIPLINRNNSDYNQSDIEIVLPFIGRETLDPYKIINRGAITLTYRVSNITGDCMAYLTDSNSHVIYQYEGNVSENIPYTLNNMQWQLKGAVDFNTATLYGFTPYILRHYKDTYRGDTSSYTNIYRVYTNDNIRVNLSDLTGIHKVTDVYITNASIIDDIKSEIYRQLENGVDFTS